MRAKRVVKNFIEGIVVQAVPWNRRGKGQKSWDMMMASAISRMDFLVSMLFFCIHQKA